MQAEVAPSGEQKRITEDTGALQTKGGWMGNKEQNGNLNLAPERSQMRAYALFERYRDEQHAEIVQAVET